MRDDANGPLGALKAAYDPTTRPEWDRLNAKQGALWLKAGRTMTPEQQALIDLMKPLTPPGF